MPKHYTEPVEKMEEALHLRLRPEDKQQAQALANEVSGGNVSRLFRLLVATADVEEMQRLVAAGADNRDRQTAAGFALPDNAVREIRTLYDEGWRQKDLAEKYGVTQAQVSRLVRGERRKRVSQP